MMATGPGGFDEISSLEERTFISALHKSAAAAPPMACISQNYGNHENRGGGRWGRGRGRGRGGRGRSGRGGHPPGLSGREIGMWHKKRTQEKNAKYEREQRQEVKMTVQHENYLTAMLESLKAAPSSMDCEEASGSSNLGSNRNDIYMPGPPVGNDQALNDWLKKDLINRQNSDRNYKQMAEFRKNLPAYKMKDKIVDLISSNQAVVISGETGCGKTTQVAQFILDDAIMKGKGSTCRIICTQPRRISAISIAERVAEERSEPVGGGSTGYQIRLESRLPRDQGSIIFCTTGVLLRWLTSDPDLSRASHVIIDEIHERSIQSDFLLIIVRDILARRRDLRVVLMSATLNAEMFSQYFNNCPMLNIPGFTFPVRQHFLEEIIKTISYKCQPTTKRQFRRGRRNEDVRREEEKWKEYLELVHSREKDRFVVDCLKNMDFDKIDHNLVEQLLMYIACNMQEGAVLVFLPGWQDISTLHKALNNNPFFSSGKFLILPLHSLMPTVNQRQIFERPRRGVRKIILSTSIAETSITIDDVVFVVDCGKTKEQNFDVDKQLATLMPVWISKASCKQRKGRAGRVQEGFCFHLYTEFHFEQLSDYQQPEILRTPLEEICLQVKSLKLGMAESFLRKALEPPSEKAIGQAILTLRQLNALDSDENLTPLGYHLSLLPVHPRIGKIILLGAIMSCLDPVLTIAASLGFRDPYVVPLNKEREADECRRRMSRGNQSDHLTLYQAFREWESAERRGNGSDFCWDNFLSYSLLKLIKNMKVQFAEHLKHIGFIASTDPKQESANYNTDNQSLIKAILCAGFYPNVISVYRPPNSRRATNRLYIQQDGRRVKVEVHPKSVNYDSKSSFQSNWLVYLEKVKSTKIFIHDCSPVSPYSLLFFGGEISVSTDEDTEIVTVDQWIKFNCRKSVSTLVQRLREELERFLEEKVRCPGLTLTLNLNQDSKCKDRQSILIRTIIDLITSE